MEKKNTTYIIVFLGFSELTCVRGLIWCPAPSWPSGTSGLYCHIAPISAPLREVTVLRRDVVVAVFVAKFSLYTLTFRDTFRRIAIRKFGCEQALGAKDRPSSVTSGDLRWQLLYMDTWGNQRDWRPSQQQQQKQDFSRYVAAVSVGLLPSPGSVGQCSLIG